jgi:chemotaxis protein histidine kinase CheA
MSEVAAPAAAPVDAPSDAAPSGADKVAAPPVDGKQAAVKPAGGDEKITVKINGKMRSLSRDEAVRELQKGMAAQEKFQKAATLTQKNQTLLRALQNPDLGARLAALKELGVDPDEIAEHRLQARAQQARMTPEQQRIAELESQIAEQERSKVENEERFQSEEQERQDREIWAKTEQEYISEIDKAIKSGQLTNIPPAEALYLMAECAEMNLSYGLDLPASELIAEAKAKVESARGDLQQKMLTLEGDALLDFLGPEAVKRVASAAVQKFKAGSPLQQLQRPAQISDPEAKPEPRKWIRPNDLKTPFF